MLTLAFAVTALVIGLSVAYQVRGRRLRADRFLSLRLQPNCLLTRYPIAFISGPRTVFRLFDHWNDVPLYLREHGYEVYVIEPTGRRFEDRVTSVEAALESFGSRCHLIADGSLERDLTELVLRRPPHATSFTLVKSLDRAANATSSPRAHDLKPTGYDVFEISAPATLASSFAWTPKLILLSLHNFLVSRRTSKVHPFETGEIAMEGFKSEQRFLDLAISLAERDVMASD